MKLSGAVEQGCCIMALLADPHNRRPLTNDNLAEHMSVSPTYLKKLTRKLVVANIISSSHGAGGGFTIARDIDTITLYDIVIAMEGGGALFQSQGIIARVFADRQEEVYRGMMAIQTIFDDAQEQWQQALQSVTMKEILEGVRHGEAQ